MAYDISPVKLRKPMEKSEEFSVEGFSLKNSRWQEAIEILCDICPHLSDRDKKKLTDYDGRFMVGKKAEKCILPLIATLFDRKNISSFCNDSGSPIPAEEWIWKDLEKIYELLCWSDGFVVR